MTYDPWALDSGGSDYEGTITDVVFAEGKYGFQATVTITYAEPLYKDDGTVSLSRPEFISIGQNDQWQAIDNGTAFKHRTKDAPKIRSNSQWGEFVDRVVSLDPSVRSKGTPFEAKTFIGFAARWMTEGAGKDYSFKDKDTQELKTGKTKGRNMPVERLSSVSANGHSTELFSLDSLGLTDTEITLLRDSLADKDISTEGKFQAAVMSQLSGLSGDSAKAVVNALGPKTAADFQMALVGI